MASRAEIDDLHVREAAKFKEVLTADCIIQPRVDYRSNWHRRALNETVEFFLWTRKGRQQYGLRSGGRGRCPIVQGKASNEKWAQEGHAWVGWREVWRRVSDGVFSLDEASFTFFWGPESVHEIQDQLFRAEWPQRSIKGDTYARPHWQVDWPLADLTRDVAGIHFGMAGWDCAPTDGAEEHISKHWRRFVDENSIRELEWWASRTIEYSLDQIAQYFPRNWGAGT